MIIAHLGGESPQQHGPRGACSTDRIPFVSRREPRGANPQPTEANPTPTADPADLALQRIRERLELAAILAGCSHPEQVAAALLGEGVRL
jgi:hypothetical protein